MTKSGGVVRRAYSFLYLFVFLISTNSFAKMSASEIESKVLKNEISFERGPLFPVPAAITDKMIALQKNKYPNFKESMWYYHSVNKDGFVHLIFYDWTGNECKFTTISEDEMRNNKISSLKEESGRVVDLSSSVVSIKICEKLYNFYSK